MRNFFKYVSALNLSSIVDQVVGTMLASGDGNNVVSDGGFGQVYRWKSLDYAFQEAKITRKPIFLLIHRPWCPACKKLKIKFSKSMKLLDISKEYTCTFFYILQTYYLFT